MGGRNKGLPLRCVESLETSVQSPLQPPFKLPTEFSLAFAGLRKSHILLRLWLSGWFANLPLDSLQDVPSSVLLAVFFEV
jgi:hypothetical protein